MILYISGSREVFRVHKLFDNIHRSPIHMAAFAGRSLVLEKVLNSLTDEEKENTFDSAGVDGMTPLHLAARGGTQGCFSCIFEQVRDFQSAAKTDIWGREVIHIATGVGNLEIARTLLSRGSRLDRFDNNRRTPVDYLVQSKPEDDGEDNGNDGKNDRNNHANAPGDDHGNAGTDATPKQDQVYVLDSTRCTILQELAKTKPDYRDAGGKTFLHIAAEVADVATIDILLKEPIDLGLKTRDDQQRTPLHCALLARNITTSLALIDNADSDLGAKDAGGMSTLMFAVSMNLMEVVEKLFGKTEEADIRKRENNSTFTEADERALAGCDITHQDNKGLTVLHHAVGIKLRDDGSNDEKIEMVKFLVSKRCNTMTEDNGGKTPLHYAIIEKKGAVAKFLLSLPAGQIPSSPKGNNLLILACQVGCPTVIPRIIELWPNIINDGDTGYQQPPISWACEGGFDDIVKMLVEDYPAVDVNRPALKYNNYTALHFATQRGHEEMLICLLQRGEADVGAKDQRGNTLVDSAILSGNPACARHLLRHPNAADEQRITYLEKLTVRRHENFHGILSDVLGKVNDKSLTDEKLKQLVDATEHLNEPRRLFELFMARCLQRKTWKQIAGENPYHRAVKLESLEVVEGLTAVGGNPAEPDQDNWSCLDYATRLGLNVDFLSAVNGHVNKHKPPNYEKPDPCEPAALSVPSELKGIIDISSCAGENHRGSSCSGLQRKDDKSLFVLILEVLSLWLTRLFALVVTVLTPSERSERACIRANHPIPPPTRDNKHFYFEITVITGSDSRILGIGFCGPDGGEDQMPGWFEGSWAYQGDDGLLFVEGSSTTPSPDFGSRGQFGVEETAGVYLNLETGQAFCTLNGRMMTMGEFSELLASPEPIVSAKYELFGGFLTI